MIDSIIGYLQPIINMLTTAEWRAVLLVLVALTSVTETVKRLILPALLVRYRKRAIYGTSLAAGMVFAYILWPKDSEIPWYILGASAGPAANFIHNRAMAIIAWKFPVLADKIKGKTAIR